MKAVGPLPRIAWKAGVSTAGQRIVPEETAVAVVHDGSTAAVMMATPADLEDFAVGFSLSEGVIDSPSDIKSIDVVEGEHGIEARMWLKPTVSARHSARRRHLIGPTGCGLCGVDSLAEAMRPARDLSQVRTNIKAASLLSGLAALENAQILGQVTRAIHAAALWSEHAAIIVREDVGRHNALDKLIGACAISGRSAGSGVLFLTSRLSVEMIQKAEVLGAAIVCAMSAPTALAVRTAERAGITLVGIARPDGFEVFTRADRIDLS